MKVKEAADCPTCPDCGEAFCEEHNEHYAECPCIGPDSEEGGEVSTNAV